MRRSRELCFFALFRIILLVAALSMVACGGGDGDSDSPQSVFRCSDSPVATDAVAQMCAMKIGKDTWQLKVVLGGPTTSTDLAGFNFDVVFDPAELSFVVGSAEQGTLLNQDGDDPLLVADVANYDPGRLIVGIHRTNQPAGVQGMASRNVIMKFCLKANLTSEFGPTLVRFENQEAVDSADNPIAGIQFSDQLTLAVQ